MARKPFETFSDEAQISVSYAFQLLQENHHHHFDVEHLLLGLLKKQDKIVRMLRIQLGVNTDALILAVQERLERQQKDLASKPGQVLSRYITPRVQHVFEAADLERLRRNDNNINNDHLLLAIAGDAEIATFFQPFNIDHARLVEALADLQLAAGGARAEGSSSPAPLHGSSGGDTPPGEQTVAGGPALSPLPQPQTGGEDSPEAYLQKMREERGYLLDFHRVMAENDFPFLKAYNGLLEAAYTQQRILDVKVKELLFVAVLCAVRSTPEHIRTHMQLAKELGTTKEEMLEVLELILPPAGVPTFMLGLNIWRQVYNVE